MRSALLLSLLAGVAGLGALPFAFSAHAQTGKSAASASAAYHQVGKIALGGEGGWDYLTVDSPAHRLYVTRGTHVMVIDTRKTPLWAILPTHRAYMAWRLRPN